MLSRRDFNAAVLLGAPLFAQPSGSIATTLAAGLQRHHIPCAVGMAATAERITYSGAFGKRDSASPSPLTTDAIFSIASMTKAITTAAAMQLVEQGKLALDEPAAKTLPILGQIQVLNGYDAAGKPVLRPVVKPITLRHLLTHTSGFCYSGWDKQMTEYQTKAGPTPPGADPLVTPLMFEPGTRWQYGIGVDWAGRMVEAVSGLTLEAYFQKYLLGPLGMKDTSFILKPAQFDRLVSSYSRQPDGTLKETPRTMPEAPRTYPGGGGLYSTAADYVRFMQMILNKGQRILKPESVALMSINQTGNLQAGKMASSRPSFSSDVDLHPGESDRYSLGFLLNPKAYAGGRSAGSLAWAGLFNTYFWIDPKRKICGVLLMQLLPFADKEALGLLSEFEQAVYAAAG